MESLKCPGCGEPMQKKKEADLTTDVCVSCGCIFLDKGELNELATGMAGDIEYCSIDNDAHRDKFPIRKCARCENQTLQKINLLRLSHTIFDYCPKCEGLFLDKNELELMNKELSNISGDGIGQEIRDYIDDHLYRVDRIFGSTLIANPKLAGEISGVETTTFRASLYYKKPLGMGLRVSEESWGKKLLKIFGLFKSLDIEIGNSKIDKSFVIEGYDVEGIINLLNSKELQNELLEFISKKPKIHLTEGSLEILDSCVVYTEGPYTGKFSVNLKEASKDVIDKMQKIVLKLEAGMNI